MKSVLIGSTGSSEEMLLSMIDVGFPVSFVFSVSEEYANNISGYKPIHEIAAKNEIPYKKFKKINDPENVELIKEIEPDYIFVIGISQLVSKEIIDAAKVGVVGFHPTALPKMRGRAANVWQVLLGIHNAKASLFFIDEGTDSGDILGQEPYIIEDNDYVTDVNLKIRAANKILFRRVLKQIKEGTLKPTPQNEEEATYLLRRVPEDGEIDWEKSISDIHRLIRATSRPYPGAYGMYDGIHKVIIWRADIFNNDKYIGLPGQIINADKSQIDVLCKDGILRITDYENVDNVKIFAGHKLK